MSIASHGDLFSSVVTDIKAYRGNDPLRPWLRGIRTLRQSLPRQTLAEKLPRFLQKCAEAFESDRRYRNDARYLRVWIHLMDHVNDPRRVLRRMEENQIGVKHAAFYVAYALYYEKQKKFEKADKMYHLGVQNLAEPAAELHKSYEQFLCRLKLHKERGSKLREAKANATSKGLPAQQKEINVNKLGNSAGHEKLEQIQNDDQIAKSTGTCQTSSKVDNKHSEYFNMMGQQLSKAHKTCENSMKPANVNRGQPILKACLPSVQHKGEVPIDSDKVFGEDCVSNNVLRITGDRTSYEEQREIISDSAKQNSLSSDDTVVVKFVDFAIVGKSEAETACHHGLVDPTINMKEAINAINSMFREPLEPEMKLERKARQNRTRETPFNSNGFEVYVDEDVDEGLDFVNKRTENTDHYDAGAALPARHSLNDKSKSFVGTFKILTDDEDDGECDDVDEMKIDSSVESSKLPDCHVGALIHPKVDNLPTGKCDSLAIRNSDYVKLKEDTVICNFVGSTVSGENEVENACHHGLVDPTINLKEAMDDINSMFGKPIDFVKTSKLRKRGYLPEQKKVHHGFSIFVDGDLDQPTGQAPLSCSGESCGESDLFEPTVFTKEVMDEINKMFGKPLDF